MKYLGALAAVVLVIGMLACGDSSSSQTATNAGTGAWSATLASSSGQELGSFTFNMVQNGTTLTSSSMNFTSLGSSLAQCFGSGTVMNGQMGPGMMNGGTMTMTMSWTPQGSASTNTMTMQGAMAMGMGSGSGNFTLTGQTPGCSSQTGAFTMTRTSTTMM